MSEDSLKSQASAVAVYKWGITKVLKLITVTEKAKISFLKDQKTKMFISIATDIGSNGSYQ